MSEVTLSNSTYDVLKRVTQVGLPALGTLYSGLAILWGFPNAEQVVGSISLLTVFFGVILGASSKSYNSGENTPAGDFVVNVTPEGKRVVQLQLDRAPEDIVTQRRIVFNVVDTEGDRFWDPNAE